MRSVDVCRPVDLKYFVTFVVKNLPRYSLEQTLRSFFELEGTKWELYIRYDELKWHQLEVRQPD